MLDPAYIRDRIRTVPDWPQPGVMFRDITPLLQDPRTLRVLVESFVLRYMGAGIDLVAGIDARGFILGSIVAYELNLGFVPVRSPAARTPAPAIPVARSPSGPRTARGARWA